MAWINKVTTCLTFILLNTALFHASQSLARERKVSSLVLGMRPSRASLPALKVSAGSRKTPTEVPDVMEPLREVRDGYLISLNIGNPPQVIQVYMDTGSDLTWVPCGNLSFDCIDCDDYRKDKLTSAYAYSPSHSSSSYRDSCASPFCIDIHSSDNSFDPCTVAGCSLSTLVKATCSRPCPSFAYTYAAGGVVTGTLTRDTLRVHASSPKGDTREIPNYCFGCIGSTYREPIGIGGFGRSVLSLPSQIGLLQKGFSHCFLAFKYANNLNISSPLVIGDVALSSSSSSSSSKGDANSMQFTPMLKSRVYPNSYYIGLEAIAIGKAGTSGTQTHHEVVVAAPSSLREFDSKGNGGMLIDSGTTYTHLSEPFYSQLLSTIQSMINYPRANQVEMRTGFDLCYKVPCPNNYNTAAAATTTTADDHDLLPSITFHFLNNVSLVLPQENHFYAMSAPSNSSVVKCLLFQSMDDGDYGPAGVYGSFQQQNVKVVYDLEKERIGFQSMDCAAAAASLGLRRNN